MFRSVARCSLPKHQQYHQIQGKFLIGNRCIRVRYQSSGGESGKSSRRGVFYLLGSVTLATGATLAYAKFDPSFRETLNSYVPYSDDMVAVMFQEKHTYSETWDNLVHGIKSKVPELPSLPSMPSLPSLPFEKKETKEDNVSPPIPVEKKAPVEKRTVEKESAPVTPQPGKKDSPPEFLKNVADLESEVSETALIAIHLYKDASKKLQDYTDKVSQIIEMPVDKLDVNTWNSLKESSMQKDHLFNDAEEKAYKAMAKVEKLKQYLSSPGTELPPNTRDLIQGSILKLETDIQLAKQFYQEEKRKGAVIEKYWNKVQESRKHFMVELQTLFPSIQLSEPHLHLTENDIDLFIIHAFRNILYYQKELAKLQTVVDERIRRALQEKEGSRSLVEAKIEAEVDKSRRNLQAEFEKKTLEMKAECIRNLRTTLKQFEDFQAEKLDNAVSDRERHVRRELERKYEEKFSEEQGALQLQLGAMIGRLRGLETALRARADADKHAHTAQHLWSACQALHSSVKYGDPSDSSFHEVKPLKSHVAAVKRAAIEGDELVNVVLNTLPSEAISRGVFTEDALRERFLHLEKVAQRIALVPELGASLPLFFMSYLQSLLLIKKFNPIPESELRDAPIDVDKLDTFDVLQRARYYIDRGDLDRTLRYMNLLKGASRQIASEWMNEVRILLETQQAARTLMAYATAEGLAYT